MTNVRANLYFVSGVLLLCAGIGCSPGSNGGSAGGSKLQMASLQNKTGKFIEPGIASGQNSLAEVKLPDDLVVWASDPEGEESYPIVTYSWILAYKTYADAKKGNALKDVLTYCVTDGQKESEPLGYIPLPAKVREKVQAALANIAVEGNAKGETVLDGAGATFPKPLYRKWFAIYKKSHPEVTVNYEAVGSEPGVKLLMDENVDFGASDSAMTSQQIAKVGRGVQCLPLTAGSIVLAYNLPGVDNLKLTREAYTGIFLGKIKKWNDKAIANANPGAKLPDQDIRVVTRIGGSGTSYVFTKHLSAISEEFKNSIGASAEPKWPVGTTGKGNEGVATLIKSTPGAIGYLEYGYVTSGK